MEKIKALFADKKTRAILIASLVAILIIIVAIVAFASTSYKRQIKSFVKASMDEEKLEKFVKNKVDLRSLYALTKSEMKDSKVKMDSFKEAYKEADKDDYKDDDFIDAMVKAYKGLGGDEDDKYVVKKIGKLKKVSKDDSVFNLKGMKKAKFTLQNKDDKDDKKEYVAYFWKGKLIAVLDDDDSNLLKSYSSYSSPFDSDSLDSLTNSVNSLY